MNSNNEITVNFSSKTLEVMNNPAKRKFERKGRRRGATQGYGEYMLFDAIRRPLIQGWVDVTNIAFRRYINMYFLPFLRSFPKGYFTFKPNWQDSYMTIKVPNSHESLIFFGSVKNIGNMEGNKFHRIFINESGLALNEEEKAENIYRNALEPMTIDYDGEMIAFGAPKGFNYFKTLYDQAESEMRAGNTRYSVHQSDFRDNPFFPDRVYETVYNNIKALPEHIVNQEYWGQFVAGGDDANAVLPSPLLIDCQENYEDMQNAGLIATAISRGPRRFGIDPSRGGGDATAFAFEYRVEWHGQMMKIYDVERHEMPVAIGTSDKLAMTFDQSMKSRLRKAGHVSEAYRQRLPGTLDYVGLGQGPFEAVQKLYPMTQKFIANSKAYGMEETGTFWFADRQTAAWWKFREDAEKGIIAIDPTDHKLFSALNARRFRVAKSGTKDIIKLESKDHDKKKLGRSPDDADAVVMAHYEASTNLWEGME